MSDNEQRSKPALQNLECPLAGVLAQRLRTERRDLTARWLSRIAARVSTDPNHIFPTDELLDHVPLLVDGIADYLESPAAEVGADSLVIGKAMELGALRHTQGFDVYEILKEYEILGGILFTFLARAVDDIDAPCERSDLVVCAHRVFRALAIIQETTTAHYLRLAEKRVAEREARLRAFNRAVSHEMKNQIGVILGASDVLHEVPGMALVQQAKLISMIGKNARFMRSTMENLVALSHVDDDARRHRHVKLPEAAAESVRQLRDHAQAQGVVTQIGVLPDVEVNAAAVELVLNNLISNAIKYADSRKATRTVSVTGAVELDDENGTTRLVIRVKDNGLGVPVDKRGRLFEQFFRAHEMVTPADGTGLGLSIVRETIESIGGEAWAEFPDEGSVFAFSLPLRRESGDDRPIDQPPPL